MRVHNDVCPLSGRASARLYTEHGATLVHRTGDGIYAGAHDHSPLYEYKCGSDSDTPASGIWICASGAALDVTPGLPVPLLPYASLAHTLAVLGSDDRTRKTTQHDRYNDKRRHSSQYVDHSVHVYKGQLIKL